MLLPELMPSAEVLVFSYFVEVLVSIVTGKIVGASTTQLVESVISLPATAITSISSSYISLRISYVPLFLTTETREYTVDNGNAPVS
jgi:hypothetical protein